MAFSPWFCENARADIPNGQTQSAQFDLNGRTFPSYLTFREAAVQHISAAQGRVCLISRKFEDRDVALALFAASRRALTTALKVAPPTEKKASRLSQLTEELRFFGLPVVEGSLPTLKPSVPTLLALDDRAWSVSSEVYEFHRGEVTVVPAALTAGEVCRWAEDSSGAKATTRP